MLPNGDIAINDDFNDRVVSSIPTAAGSSGSTATRHARQGPNELNTPDGMDFVPLGPHENPLWHSCTIRRYTNIRSPRLRGWL